MASREIFWNVQLGEIVYLLGFVVAVIVAYACYRRLRLWRLGGKDERLGTLGSRMRTLLRTAGDGLWHRRIVRDRYAGVMHILIVGGFGLLLLGPLLDFVSEHFFHFMTGGVYLGISLLLDVGGLLVLAGVGMAICRRYVIRPQKLDNLLDDALALALLVVIITTGFIVEGLRIATTELESHAGWAVWSPVGFVFAQAFSGLGDGVNVPLHHGLWWGHAIVSLGAIVYVFVTFSRLAHILAAPLNMFFKIPEGKGVLRPVEISETTETFGAGKIQDLTWKDLLDLDACTRCGRCQEVCPAYLTGKPLSPKNLIQELRSHLVEQGKAVLRGKRGGKRASDTALPALLEGAVTEDELWGCTTCAACEEACPVFVQPIGKIVDMRRNLVLEQGKIPATMMAALRSIQDRGHPWKGASTSRTDWASGLRLSTLSTNGGAGLLFWVGCTAAVQERGANICISMAKILAAAGIDIGLLGHEESCCGHMARRIGDEYLFQCQAKQNIETLRRHNVTKIVTACPHCYHTLKYEYPQFGGEFEVVHHTELLLELVRDGRLEVGEELSRVVAYQDPCYLGRYHDIYEAPREILAAIPGIEVVEMGRCSSESLCCGAGGGRMWMEEEPSQRVNRMRVEEAVATGADLIVTACPFCLQMFEDGARALAPEDPVEVLDLVELLARVVTSAKVPVEPPLPVKVEVIDSRRRVAVVGGGHGVLRAAHHREPVSHRANRAGRA